MSAAIEREVLATPAELAAAAADVVETELAAAVDRDGAATLVLSGGSTPRALYRLLATPERRARVPWDRVEFLFGDERCVRPIDVDSNYRMAHEALLGALAPDPGSVHRIRGELPPGEAAADYEARLRARFGEAGPPRFDLVLLGLGGDGHTASLFPGDAALDETARLAVAARAPVEPRDRVTLTFPVLNAARRVLFLVAGADKAPAVARVASGDATAPAARVAPAAGRCTWLLDRAAAAGIAGRGTDPAG